MRLLQVSLRSLLLYALLLVLISIPVSYFTIREIIQHEIDESLNIYQKEFVKHIKNFEYLDDLELDLQVLDDLTHDVTIKPGSNSNAAEVFRTVSFYDSLEMEEKPFRELTSQIVVKNKPYILTIRMSLVGSEQLGFVIVGMQAVLIALLVTGLILVNRSLSRRLWEPFYKTLNKLKVYEVDKNQSFEYENTEIQEFDDLNVAIQQLTSKNKLLFEHQKEFIENASHELQTPLAIFQSKLDVLMQQPGLTERQATIISELVSTAQRMGRLNRTILLLSKIDNEQFSDSEPIELDLLIRSQLEHILPLINNRGITVHSSISQTKIVANRTLLEILTHNLLTNALRHNMDNGRIEIALRNNQLEINNTGPALASPEKIFERFSKESSDVQSSGLGLALVHKICTICGYTIEYSYQGGMHRFSIKL